jgi:diguanylate cyclase (GGDEF)-like protein
MMPPLRTLDQHLDRLTRPKILVLAACGVLIVGGVDYVTGYEVGMSLFYLGPVAIAAWYAGRRVGSAIAVLSCISWYTADLAAGNQYSHPAIPVWNAFIRLGFFYITGSLLTALRESLRAQQQLARTDGLTGLYVRREFDSRLKHDLAMAQRRNGALTLAYVDLDDFKTVNDTHGHAGGDRLLRAIARVLRSSVREVDTVARIGGDEFALILPDTDGRGAQQAISKLTCELHEALGATDFGVTCSIGVVTFLDSATSPEHAVAAADELMYQVKHKGKGAVAFSVLGEAVQPRAAADAPQAARP